MSRLSRNIYHYRPTYKSISSSKPNVIFTMINLKCFSIKAYSNSFVLSKGNLHVYKGLGKSNIRLYNPFSEKPSFLCRQAVP